MEATVTIALKEVEQMKSTINNLQREISELKAQKDFRLTIDGDLYDYNSRNRVFSGRVFAYGHLEEVTGKGYQEVRDEMQTLFNKLLSESPYLKFYKKFPKWVHKLLKCN